MKLLITFLLLFASAIGTALSSSDNGEGTNVRRRKAVLPQSPNNKKGNDDDDDAKNKNEPRFLRQHRRRLKKKSRQFRPRPRPPPPERRPPPPERPPPPPRNVRNDLEELVHNVKQHVEEVIKAFDPELGNLAAKFVRMGFHDCVGGCDGCIDMSDADNKGLEVPIAALEPVVEKWENDKISRADIWAIACLVGAEVSLPPVQQNRGRFPLNFVGRKNCEDRSDVDPCIDGKCDARNGPVRHLPSPDLTTREMKDWFRVNFGLSTREMVALMGAHTLGTMSRKNSGFDGPWVVDKDVLDNDFYKTLIGGRSPATDDIGTMFHGPKRHLEKLENKENGTPDRWQWTHVRERDGGLSIMTNSDLALVRDLDREDRELLLDKKTGEPKCRYQCDASRANFDCTSPDLPPPCPAAKETMRMCSEYKNDNERWLRDFAAVMEKMCSHGYRRTTTPGSKVSVLAEM